MSLHPLRPPFPRLCALAGAVALFAALAGQARDWPQWLGEGREGVWRETGLVARFPKDGPKVLWRVPIGPGYGGPAVAGDRVYVMDRQRPKGAADKPQARGGAPGKERVLCLSATDGKPLWEHGYDCTYRISYGTGPRTTPLVHRGRVYTLGAMGDLRCLDAATGKPRWSKSLPGEYKPPTPVWGWAACPLLDGDLLYCLVGGEGSAVVAFHKDTGRQVWKALTTEEIGYSPPVLIEAGGKRQLIVWLSETINSLDPATGQVYWAQKYPTSGEPERPAVNIATPRRLGDALFFTSAYHGPMMLKLDPDKPAASLAWKGKSDRMERPDGLHSLMPTPVLKDGHIYGVCASGELRCLDARTGKQRWATFAAVGGKKTDCGTAFLVPQGDRFVLFNDQGDLILAELTPKGYNEIDRAHILDPVQQARGRKVVWSHPAFARRCVFARNDKELVCVSLAQKDNKLPAAADLARKPKGPSEKEPDKKSLDKKALDLVKRVSDMHKKAKSLHVEVGVVTYLGDGGKKRETRCDAVYDLERPNRFSLRTRVDGDAGVGPDLVCDGKQLFVHGKRIRQYTEKAAPGDLAGVGRGLPRFGHPTTGMLFQNVLTGDPYDTLVDGVTVCSYEGKVKVNGAEAHHLKFTQPDLKWELWVAAEGKPFVLKVASTRALEAGNTTTVETYKNWKIDAAPAKGVFTFTPPKESKKVKVFTAGK